MCDCISKLDAMLKPHNTRLAVTIVFGKALDAFPTIQTEQVEKGRGKPKAKAMMPTFCPFCGERYARDDAQAEPHRPSADLITAIKEPASISRSAPTLTSLRATTRSATLK